MKVQELIDFLSQLNPNAEVVVHRDADNYGYGYVKRIGLGVFELTGYGNDFFEDFSLVVNPAQTKAVCIFPEDYDDVDFKPEGLHD